MIAETKKDEAVALLRWYAAMGVDEATAPAPTNFFDWRAAAQPAKARPPKAPAGSKEPPAPSLLRPENAPPPADEAVALAREAAAAAATPEELVAAIEAFDACPLKAGARNTVVCDGVFGADLMVIGEAPGRDEDRTGKPFVGRAGQLLDRMLAAIGRARQSDTLITNVIYWRPPGNRTPTAAETAICRPFVERMIALNEPRVIVLAGGAPLQAMLGVNGIMRARGKWREITVEGLAPIPALPMFHPAFLLRQPAQKRLAWHDLLMLDARLTSD